MVIKCKRQSIIRVTLFLYSFLILLPLVTNQAVLGSQVKQRVYDFAGLLSNEETRNLEALAAQHSEKRQTDFIILTSPDAEGKDVMKYMEAFYDENGLGFDRPFGNTVMVTLNMQERDVYVGGFYKGKEFLDDERSSRVIKNISPDLSRGSYYQAFTTFIKTSSKYMSFRPGVNPDSLFFNIWAQLGFSLLIGGGVVGIMTYRSSPKMTATQSTYLDPSNSRVIERRDDYIRTTTTKVRKPKDNASGGSSGFGGGGGVSAGGHSHSGSRGKF